MDKEAIETLSKKIHKELNIKQVPVAIEQIVKKLNIKIKKAPSNDFSGLLLRKDGKALIGINSLESSVRQRFTIAHELGHFFLHPTKDAFVDYRDNQSSIIRNQKERDANFFAASFLMPQKSLTEDIKKLSGKGIFDAEIESLARKYEVSKEAMNYRILNLGFSIFN